MVIASSAGGSRSTYELRNYPLAKAGHKLTPYKIRNITTVFDEHMTMHWYNLSSAAYGYHLVLQPNFTEAGQRVIAVSSQSNVLGDDVFKFIAEIEPVSDMDYKYCLYSSAQASCRTNCCKDIDGKQLNSTCVAHASGDVCSSAQCDTGSRCYNTQIDRCDGFSDCEDRSDEIGCYLEDSTLPDDDLESDQTTVGLIHVPENHTAHDNTTIAGENTPGRSNKGWIAAPVIFVFVIIIIVYALCRRRIRYMCYRLRAVFHYWCCYAPTPYMCDCHAKRDWSYQYILISKEKHVNKNLDATDL